MHHSYAGVQFPAPEFVAADLSVVSISDALKPTSFDPSKRTMFFMEGLIYYLPPAALQQLLSDISASCVAGSRLQFDFLHLSVLRGKKWMPGFDTLSLVSAKTGLGCVQGLGCGAHTT